MKFPTLHTSLRGILLGATLMVGACGDKQAAAPALADYWKPAAAHLAGSYGGQCVGAPGSAPVAGELAIKPNGRFTFNGVTGDFRTMPGANLSRTAAGGGADALLVRVDYGPMELKFQSGPDGKGSAVAFKSAKMQLKCDMPDVAFPLAGKPLYMVYASVLDTAPTKIVCGFDDEKRLDFSFKDGSVTLGDLDYDLSGMNEEVVLRANATEMEYRASFKDGSDITITFDKHGKRTKVWAMIGGTLESGGSSLPCDEN